MRISPGQAEQEKEKSGGRVAKGRKNPQNTRVQGLPLTEIRGNSLFGNKNMSQEKNYSEYIKETFLYIYV